MLVIEIFVNGHSSGNFCLRTFIACWQNSGWALGQKNNDIQPATIRNFPAVIPQIPCMHRWLEHSCTSPEHLLVSTDQVAQHLFSSPSCRLECVCYEAANCSIQFNLRQQDMWDEWHPAAKSVVLWPFKHLLTQITERMALNEYHYINIFKVIMFCKWKLKEKCIRERSQIFPAES